ncbi:hypothetical protein Tco_0280828 [Tanacetum coccineum]
MTTEGLQKGKMVRILCSIISLSEPLYDDAFIYDDFIYGCYLLACLEVGVFILLLMCLLSIFILQKRTGDETVVATAVGVVEPICFAYGQESSNVIFMLHIHAPHSCSATVDILEISMKFIEQTREYRETWDIQGRNEQRNKKKFAEILTQLKEKPPTLLSHKHSLLMVHFVFHTLLVLKWYILVDLVHLVSYELSV